MYCSDLVNIWIHATRYLFFIKIVKMESYIRSAEAARRMATQLTKTIVNKQLKLIDFTTFSNSMQSTPTLIVS